MVTPYFPLGYQRYLQRSTSTDSFKPRKNITVFVSITDRKTRVSRDAQNVCAVTIVGTALNTNFSVSLHHRLGTSFARNYPFNLSLAWRTSTNFIIFLLTQNIQNVQFRNRYRICLQLVKRFS